MVSNVTDADARTPIEMMHAGYEVRVIYFGIQIKKLVLEKKLEQKKKYQTYLAV
jgi:hypothetical protein